MAEYQGIDMKIGIIGASGFTGGELLRILLFHSKCEVACATSRTFEGREVALLNPNLRGVTDLKFENLSVSDVAERSDFVFTATPHGKSMNIVPELGEAGIKVVDLAGDFRFNDAKVYEEYYGTKHVARNIKATYGLPELHRSEIKKAELVANPGCYSTSVILGLIPLIKEGIVELDRIVADSKSGISGAGSKPKPITMYTSSAEDITPYKTVSHQHLPEIEQELNLLREGVQISFVPHIVPLTRGILSTIHVFLREKISANELSEVYANFYQGEPFVRTLDAGEIPKMSAVRGSNYCDLGGFEIDEQRNRAVVISVIDNLVKGASGQAVQNMNIMMGFKETEGLKKVGLHP